MQEHEHASKGRGESNEVEDEDDADIDFHTLLIPDSALEEGGDPHAGERKGGEDDNDQRLGKAGSYFLTRGQPSP